MLATISHTRRKVPAPSAQWPVDRKINLVIEGLRRQRPVAQLCREAGVSTAHYYRWRQQFLDDQGELKPQYRPPPLLASFMHTEGAASSDQILVPDGPSELW